MKQRVLLVTAVVVAVLGQMAVVPAAAHPRPSPRRFSGSCHFDITVRFVPPITSVPATGSDEASGSGTCNGVPATYTASDSGVTSCQAARMVGTATVGIGRAQFPMVLNETRVGPAATLVFDGVNGGSGMGTAVLSPDTDPVAVAAACSSTGLSSAAVQVDVTLDDVGASTAKASHMRA